MEEEEDILLQDQEVSQVVLVQVVTVRMELQLLPAMAVRERELLFWEKTLRRWWWRWFCRRCSEFV
jgi:hypothetical protein